MGASVALRIAGDREVIQAFRRAVRGRQAETATAKCTVRARYSVLGDHLNSFGGASERATPVPIPNTEVKPLSADGTWVETPWESRSPPDFETALVRSHRLPSGRRR